MTDTTTDPYGTDLDVDPFDEPAQTGVLGKDTMNDLKGSLLVVMPTAHRDHYKTKFSKDGEDSPAVQANVLVVDGPLAGSFYEGIWFWNRVLVSQFGSKVGSILAGRLGLGEARNGNSAPWQLEPSGKGTDDRTKAGQAYRAWKAERDVDPFSH